METRPPGFPATCALAFLVAAATAAPWAFGAVQPEALRLVATAALGASALALAIAAARGGAELPDVPLWPLAAFAALASLQLLPLPPALHALVAPGSHAVWHPADPLAAAVLGPGGRPVSIDPRTTLSGLALAGGLGLLAALAAPALARARPALWAAGTVAAAGFAMAAYAVFARARFGALLYGTIRVPTIAPFGPFVNKNHFAGWAVMAALVAFGLAAGLVAQERGRGGDWTRGRSAAGVVLALVAGLALSLAVVASLSRGGAFALLAGAAALAVLLLRERGLARASRRLAPAVGAGVLLLALLLAAVPDAARERLRSITGAGFRLETWRDSVRLFGSSPLLGSGLGAFHDAYPRFKGSFGDLRVEHAESEYLELLAETGVVGAGLVLAGLAFLLRAGAGSSRTAGHGAATGVGLGGTAALVALAAHALLDFDLRIPSNAALAALAGAAAAGRAGLRPRRLAPAACAALAVVAVALLLTVASRPLEPWLDVREEALAAAAAPTSEVRHLRLERAAAAASRVLSARPAHAEAWLTLAGTRSARGDAAAAAALARHALRLDPQRPELARAARSYAATPLLP